MKRVAIAGSLLMIVCLSGCYVAPAPYYAAPAPAPYPQPVAYGQPVYAAPAPAYYAAPVSLGIGFGGRR